MSKVLFIDTNYKYGFHISKLPSFYKTFEILKDEPYNCYQIYISNSRSFELPKFDLIDILKARHYLEKNQSYLCIHGSLLYNFCGTTKHKKDPKFDYCIKKYCSGLIRELDIGVGLGAGVVIHPGSCIEKEKGLKTISKCLEFCLTYITPEIKKIAKELNISTEEAIKMRKVILENAAGEGTKVAVTFEEISKIINYIPEKLRKQVKVCIDTAHAFGAGLYKWGDEKEVKRFYKDFESQIGLNYLEVFHLNDSKKSDKKSLNAPFGSKKDRHESLVLGYIFEDGKKGLREFFLQAKDRKIPIISETPPRPIYKDGKISEWDWLCAVHTLKDEKEPLQY